MQFTYFQKKIESKILYMCICVSLPNSHKFQLIRPQRVTLFEQSIFTEAIQLKWGHQQGFNSISSVLVGGNLNRNRPRWTRWKIGRVVCHTKRCSTQAKEGRLAVPFQSWSSEEANLINGLIFGQITSGLGDNNFQLFKPPRFCHSMAAVGN